MNLARGSRAFAAGLLLVAPLAGGVAFGSPAAWAGAATVTYDTTPPTTPSNLRQIGTSGGQTVLGWDAATDDSGRIYHYWVLADGQQIYRPSATSVRVSDLVKYCHLIPGHTYAISIQATDRSLNRSAPTASIQVTIR